MHNFFDEIYLLYACLGMYHMSFLYYIHLSLLSPLIHAPIHPANHLSLYLSLILLLGEFGFGEVREHQGDAN